MKILYIITSTNTGGAEKALSALAVSLSKEHQIKVISILPKGKIACDMEEKGIEVISLNISGYVKTGVVKEISAIIESFKPDIVHGMLYRGMQFARLACAGKKVKLITTPHFDLSKKNFILKKLDFFLKDLDRLTVVESLYSAKYLIEKQHYRKEKVFLLPNSVDKNMFYPDLSIRKNMREKYGYTPDQTIFISVARLAAVKDPIVLLQSFRNVLRKNPHARLIFVGEGAEKEKLIHFIKESGISKEVLLVGEQSNINDWLNMADVFVLSSVEESLPLALLEAICAGKPCVVSNVGDMPLWVEHGVNGFVFKPKDITLLSCFMEELASSLDLIKKMSDKSLEKASNMNNNIEQYKEIYQQLFNNSFHVKTLH